MPTFTIEMTVTEITRQSIDVEAESAEEALRLVEEYEIDNSTAIQIGSFEWSISDAVINNREPEGSSA